jgi:hypothetical protein
MFVAQGAARNIGLEVLARAIALPNSVFFQTGLVVFLVTNNSPEFYFISSYMQQKGKKFSARTIT